MAVEIKYKGGNKYQVSKDDQVIELSTKEMIELYNNISEHLLVKKPEKKKRPYHKKRVVYALFEKYHDDNKTKAETFTKIAKELGISYKAVEKACYPKHKKI